METKEQIETRIKENFKDHIIRDHQMIYRADCPNVEVMTWGDRRGGSAYRVDYMLRNDTLCVYGDLGEAVYQWYGPTSLEWISSINVGYFHGKCEASRTGARGMEWDNKKALKEMKTQVVDIMSCDPDVYRNSKHPGAKKALKKFLDTEGEKQGLEMLYSGDPALAFGGDEDWWEWLPTCGEVFPVTTYYHGLKMAFRKVKPC
jgi:hypothetical protein